MTQSTLFDRLESVRSIADAEVRSYLPEPKAKPRDPLTAETLSEFCKLYEAKYEIKTTSKEQNDWMESHPEQMERDFPGCKRRCVALRRMALEPQYVAAKATLKKALEED